MPHRDTFIELFEEKKRKGETEQQNLTKATEKKVQLLYIHLEH